jgi:hypothetical protein
VFLMSGAMKSYPLLALLRSSRRALHSEIPPSPEAGVTDPPPTPRVEEKETERLKSRRVERRKEPFPTADSDDISPSVPPVPIPSPTLLQSPSPPLSHPQTRSPSIAQSPAPASKGSLSGASSEMIDVAARQANLPLVAAAPLAPSPFSEPTLNSSKVPQPPLASLTHPPPGSGSLPPIASSPRSGG